MENKNPNISTHNCLANISKNVNQAQTEKKLLEQVINKWNSSSICLPVFEIFRQQTATM